jgi:anthranilate phosphoribosyltransferase
VLGCLNSPLTPHYIMSLLPYLHRLLNRESLSTADAKAAMAAILKGTASTAQVAAFLVALRMKGETADELVGLAQAMRASCLKVNAGPGEGPLLDTCGTGGDGHGTFNVSTLAAFVAAGAGVRVAKHGNRSVSSRCGSADVLEALGARVDLDPEEIARAIRETGFGFLFAPRLHPALQHVTPARNELKTRTVFNLLGPLCNPAAADVQVVGAPSPQAAELMAVALSTLGLERGYVVHGHDGLDEVSTTGPSHLLEIRHGAIFHTTITPDEFGVRRAGISKLRGGDAASNALLARRILTGEPGPCRDLVLVNASVALVAAGKCADFREGVVLAAGTIDSGAALSKLEQYTAFTQMLPVR